MRLRDAKRAMRALKKKRAEEETNIAFNFFLGFLGPSSTDMIDAAIVLANYDQAKRRQRRRIARKAARARWGRR